MLLCILVNKQFYFRSLKTRGVLYGQILTTGHMFGYDSHVVNLIEGVMVGQVSILWTVLEKFKMTKLQRTQIYIKSEVTHVFYNTLIVRFYISFSKLKFYNMDECC